PWRIRAARSGQRNWPQMQPKGSRMILRSAWTVRATLLLASGSIGTLAAASAGAHDVWLTADKSGDQLSAQINNGDADKRDIPDRNRVVTLDLIDSGGTLDLRRPLKPGQRLGQPVLETKPFPISAGSVLAISYDNGFWINAAANKTEINTTKLMVADGTSAHWTVKYGKLLLGP